MDRHNEKWQESQAQEGELVGDRQDSAVHECVLF
jgi:hypothetical protein